MKTLGNHEQRARRARSARLPASHQAVSTPRWVLADPVTFERLEQPAAAAVNRPLAVLRHLLQLAVEERLEANQPRWAMGSAQDVPLAKGSTMRS
jgi:hypothetical protein